MLTSKQETRQRNEMGSSKCGGGGGNKFCNLKIFVWKNGTVEFELKKNWNVNAILYFQFESN